MRKLPPLLFCRLFPGPNPFACQKMLDVFGRYVLGWMVAYRELANIGALTAKPIDLLAVNRFTTRPAPHNHNSWLINTFPQQPAGRFTA